MPNAGRAAAVADIAKPASLLPVHEMCGLLSTRPSGHGAVISSFCIQEQSSFFY